jgi:hypothetical protein
MVGACITTANTPENKAVWNGNPPLDFTTDIATLNTGYTTVTAVMNLPRGQIVNRSTLLKEVDTDTAHLLEQVADLDDLVQQFDTTDAGKRFIEAWKRARIIVDTGHSPAGTPPTPPAPPAPPHP